MTRFMIALTIVTLGFVVLNLPVLCGCSTREMAYRATLKSELRNLAHAESTFADSAGRYSDRFDELDFYTTPYAVVTIRLSDAGWSAIATHNARPEARCTMALADSMPVCEGFYYPQYTLFARLTGRRRPAR